jgi:hypothetical protein
VQAPLPWFFALKGPPCSKTGAQKQQGHLNSMNHKQALRQLQCAQEMRQRMPYKKVNPPSQRLEFSAALGFLLVVEWQVTEPLHSQWALLIPIPLLPLWFDSVTRAGTLPGALCSTQDSWVAEPKGGLSFQNVLIASKMPFLPVLFSFLFSTL